MNKIVKYFVALIAIVASMSANADVPVFINQGPEIMSLSYSSKPDQSNIQRIIVVVDENVLRICGNKQCTSQKRCELVKAIKNDLEYSGIPPKQILTRLPGKCSKK
jgi:hypothetical protein